MHSWPPHFVLPMNTRALAFALPFAALSSGLSFSQDLVVRLNCGGGDLTAQNGAVYEADREYLPTVQNGYVGGTPGVALSGLNGSLIGGLDNPLKQVYYTSRQDWDAYHFEVPNGDYIVRLQFSENYVFGVDIRRFTVTIEGTPVLVDLDVADELGLQYGGEFAALVTVSDGVLDIVGTPSETDPPLYKSTILNGLEIWEAPASFTGPEAVTGLVVRPSYHRNLLNWDWRDDPTVAGYRVYRADDAGGPFAPIDTIWAGPPRYFDDGATLGVEHHYQVAAIDFDGNEGTPSSTGSAIALDSADSDLRVYDVTISPENLKWMSENLFAEPDTEVPCEFTYEGKTWTDSETRFRGNISKYFSKHSWKLKFPATNRFEGRRKLNLKSSFIDPSMVRERTSAGLYEQVGVNGFEARHVHLRVNGEYIGVYLDVEQVDEYFLGARDRDLNASIYKCYGNMSPLPTVAAYEATYEKKTNESISHADLIELIEFLDATPGPDIVRELAERVDIDQYLSYLAVAGWTGDQDTVKGNYYLNHDLDLERWELYPWDSDLNFGLVSSLNTLPVLWGTSFVTSDPLLIHRLRERILTQDAFLWRYVQKLYEIDALYANPATLLPVMQGYLAEIDLDVQADPFKYGWESPIPFLGSAAFYTTFLPIRSAFVLADAAAVEPAGPPTDVWINELVAADQDHFADETGEFDDWLELYNASGSDIDVGGMYLTDDLADPTQFQIPASTIIPAGGHLVVICDDDPAVSLVHANFKLSTGGEVVGLFDTDGTTLLDFIHWGPQVKNVSFGRYADGKAYFEPLGAPTPGNPNTTAGNLPPKLTWVENVPGLPTSTQDVTITTKVVDSDGLLAVDMSWQVDGGGFTTVAMTPIGADRYESVIPAQPNGSVVDFFIRAEDIWNAEAYKPLEGPPETFTYVHTDPVQSLLRVNEFMASNDTAVEDPDGPPGEFDDWLELYNGSAVAIDVGGMYMTDDLADALQWQIPGSHVIPPGGHLVIWCDDQPEQGDLHATFKLGGGGEEIGLFDTDANGNALLDGFVYGPQDTDFSEGPLDDGQATDYRLLDPSPGAPNQPGLGETVHYTTNLAGKNLSSLTATSAPTLGNLLTFDFGSTVPDSVGVLYFGVYPSTSDFGAIGINLVVAVPSLSQLFMTDPLGGASLSVSIPDHPVFLGVGFFAQSLVSGGTLSNAVHATIGS